MSWKPTRFVAPRSAGDLSACSSCGTDPPLGTCGVDYTCVNGACGASSGVCECDAGYLGFTCEHGRGVCPEQFGCGDGSCEKFDSKDWLGEGICVCVIC